MGLLFTRGSGNCLPSWMRTVPEDLPRLVEPGPITDRALAGEETVQLTRAGLPLRTPGASLTPRLRWV